MAAHRDAPLCCAPTAIGVRRGPDRRQHPRPQHPPTTDVDRLEHRLYPLHLPAGREAAGRRCAAPDGLPGRKGSGRRHPAALPPGRPIPGGDPLPANSCIFVGPEDPGFAGPQALSAPNCCACNSATARGIESRPLRLHLSPPPVISRCPASKLSVPSYRPPGPAIAWRNAIGQKPRNGNMKDQHRRIQQSRRVTVRLGILGACQGVRHLLKY